MKRRGGAPRKAPEGLTEVLFVRIDPALSKALVARVKAEAGGTSKADVVRAALRAHLAGSARDEHVVKLLRVLRAIPEAEQLDALATMLAAWIKMREESTT